MAREGLFDDSGYDFFDASDCANYESCREEAYNDGYEKGASDMENAKQIIIDALLKQLEVVRADAIDECINTIVGTQSQIALNEPYDKHLFTVIADRQHEIIDLLEQLKEQNNGSK